MRRVVRIRGRVRDGDFERGPHPDRRRIPGGVPRYRRHPSTAEPSLTNGPPFRVESSGIPPRAGFDCRVEPRRGLILLCGGQQDHSPQHLLWDRLARPKQWGMNPVFDDAPCQLVIRPVPKAVGCSVGSPEEYLANCSDRRRRPGSQRQWRSRSRPEIRRRPACSGLFAQWRAMPRTTASSGMTSTPVPRGPKHVPGPPAREGRD